MTVAELLNKNKDETRRELIDAVELTYVTDYPINDCVDDVLTDEEQK